METTPQSPVGAMPGRMPEREVLSDPVSPMNDASMDGQHIKERAMHIAQGAMDIGSRAIHAVSDKIHDYSTTPEGTRGKGRMIAIGSMAAAGIGMMARRRQQSKTAPKNIVGKAKDLIHAH